MTDRETLEALKALIDYVEKAGGEYVLIRDVREAVKNDGRGGPVDRETLKQARAMADYILWESDLPQDRAEVGSAAIRSVLERLEAAEKEQVDPQVLVPYSKLEEALEDTEQELDSYASAAENLAHKLTAAEKENERLRGQPHVWRHAGQGGGNAGQGPEGREVMDNQHREFTSAEFGREAMNCSCPECNPDLHKEREEHAEEMAALQACIDAALALHREEGGKCVVCAEGYPLRLNQWPCSTYKVLKGEGEK